MVTDSQLKERLAVLLAESDLQTTTEKMLRKKLEEEFGEDLSGRKELIREEVTAFLVASQKDDGDGSGSGEEEEEEEAGARRGGGGGFSKKTCVLSQEMQAFLGVVKEIWAYIKERGLQDPSNKRKIVLDEKLSTIFTHPVDMFSMNKQLSKHVKAADAVHGGGSSGDEADGGGGGGGGKRAAAAKPRRASGARKRPAKEDAEGGGAKKAKRAAGGFCAAMRISAELAGVTGKSEMSRSELTSWFWNYVKSNELQDPSDKSFILADATLKRLFGEDRFKGFGFQRLLKPHVVGKAEGGSKAEGAADEEDGDAGADADGGGVAEEEGAAGVKEEEGAAVAVKEEAAGVKAEEGEALAAVKGEAAAGEEAEVKAEPKQEDGSAGQAGAVEAKQEQE